MKLRIYKNIFLYFRMEAEYNPWDVLSIEAFHFYNCPECEDKYSSKKYFIDHALVSHPKSRKILPTIYQTNDSNSTKSISESQAVKLDVAPDIDSFIKIESPSKPEPNTSEINTNIEGVPEHLKQSQDIQDLKRKLLYKFKCDQCQKSYTHKSHLKCHIKRVHEGLTFNCDQCSKQYKDKISLKRHIENVHDGVTYTCDHCHKVFKQQRHLNAHVRYFHSGITYKCDQCDKELHTAGGMALHKATVHPDENTKVYCCDICSYSSYNPSNFREHYKRCSLSEVVVPYSSDTFNEDDIKVEMVDQGQNNDLGEDGGSSPIKKQRVEENIV